MSRNRPSTPYLTIDKVRLLGQTIRAAREAQGIPRSNLAKGAGVPLAILASLEEDGQPPCPTPAQIGAIARALAIDLREYLPARAGTGPGIATLAAGAGLLLLLASGGCTGLLRSLPAELRQWHLIGQNTARLELEVEGAVTDTGTASQHLRDAADRLLPQCGGEVQVIGEPTVDGKAAPPKKDDHEGERPQTVSKVEGIVACGAQPPVVSTAAEVPRG